MSYLKSVFRGGLLSRSFCSSPSFFHPRISKEHEAHLTRVERNLIPLERNKVLEQIFTKILSNDQADFLSKFPIGFAHESSVKEIYQREGYEMEEMEEMLEDLKKVGFILDLNFLKERFLYFPDMVVGFFEYFWMVDRSGNFPVSELGPLFDEYLHETFIPSLVINRENPLSIPNRSLVYENVVPEVVEILDFEAASKIIENADTISIAHCPCRAMYYQKHPEKDPSEYPSETCFGFDVHAEAVGKVGIGRIITSEEGLEILKECRDLGMGQSCDNSKMPTALCNCVKDSCVMYGAVNRSKNDTVNKTRFVANYNEEKCISCKACVQRCPINLYSFVDEKESKKIVFDNEDKCWGCGICANYCPEEAITMIERIDIEEYEKQVPENFIDFAVNFLIENERLHDVICFDQQSSMHQFFRPIVRSFEKSGIGKGLIRSLVGEGLKHMKKHDWCMEEFEEYCSKKENPFLDQSGAEFENLWDHHKCD